MEFCFKLQLLHILFNSFSTVHINLFSHTHYKKIMLNYQKERLTKFILLFSQNEARKLNHQEVAEEDRRKKLPANWEAKQRRIEWETKDEDARKVIKYMYYQ